ncbi:MAG: YggT family protein [Oscillospiraceae bacterium]|nr:YggT family protein [Oscillospiraceae bacterium]
MLRVLIARFLFVFIRLFELFFVGRVIISWLPLDYSNPIVRFLYTFTEPVLAPIRNFLLRFRFFQSLPIDFSPLLVFVLLDIIRSLLIQIL